MEQEENNHVKQIWKKQCWFLIKLTIEVSQLNYFGGGFETTETNSTIEYIIVIIKENNDLIDLFNMIQEFDSAVKVLQ